MYGCSLQGLSLAKHARRATELFDAITVSLDGTDRETYAAIRGLDAFRQGLRGCPSRGRPRCTRPSLRVTLQRRNYRQLPAFVELAKNLGARQVSFLAVDIANPTHLAAWTITPTISRCAPEDLPVFDQLLDTWSGSMRRISLPFHRREPTEAKPYPPILRRDPGTRALSSGSLQCAGVLRRDRRHRSSAALLLHLRAAGRAVTATGARLRCALAMLANERWHRRRCERQIRAGMRAECKTCVCSMWRDPERPSAIPANAFGVFGVTGQHLTFRADPARKRLKVVLYNPRAVFFTMPLALLAIGSELDPERLRGRDDRRAPRPRRRETPCYRTSARPCALGLPCSPARRSPMRCAYRARRSARGLTCPWSGAAGIRPCFPASVCSNPRSM